MFKFEKFLRSYSLSDTNSIKKVILPKVNGTVKLGRHSLASNELEVRCWKFPKTVSVGKYCSIGKCYFIIDANHNPSYASTFPFKELLYSWDAPMNELIKDIPTVENDVWICDESYIHSGVVIHDGAIVAGNAVVTKDVPPYAMVAGNPAKIVKYRFDEKTIERLLQVQWWDLPDDIVFSKLAPNINNIEKFLSYAEMYKESIDNK